MDNRSTINPYIGHYNTCTINLCVFYIQLPSNVSLLNEFMCELQNREGTLCGKRKDGYDTALYSYTLECSKSWRHGSGWILHYVLELFPITYGTFWYIVVFHVSPLK